MALHKFSCLSTNGVYCLYWIRILLLSKYMSGLFCYSFGVKNQSKVRMYQELKCIIHEPLSRLFVCFKDF